MHFKVIACEVVAREVYHCAARSLHTLDVTLFSQGLHDNSDTCRAELQAQIEAVDPERYTALLLGYGLCNNSIVGLRAGRVPVVIPRAHDCITFFLGSKERYAQLFAERPGTYWYTSGWLEYAGRGGERTEYRPNSGLAKRMKFQELVEKYGEENARYLAESMSQWEVHYTHGCLIEFPFTAHLPLAEKVREICAARRWQYCVVPGDLSLIQDWLDGNWDAARFLTLQPGQEVKGCYDERVIVAAGE